MSHDSLVLCKSVHHGNSRLIAGAIAEVLSAEVVDPEEASIPTAGQYTLVGIGSGIYFGRFHHSIRQWVKALPNDAGRNHRAFIFSTSGLSFLSRFYHLPLKRALLRKGFDVVAEFSCRGNDTFGLLQLIGGINRKHPDAVDVAAAREFAIGLMQHQ